MSGLPLQRIGTTRLLQEIGSGGMAVIYKAVQETLNRTVAVKALKPSVARESSFAIRFEREAMSVSSLQHENIIHVYDFHKIDGALYIIMEFVEGIDLYDLLEKAPVLPIDVAAIIALQISRALDYAHYRGIIHRDIKPANIMIGKQGTVKLMDFGIARDRSFGDLTEAGTGLGTPSYMSPEQILGDRLDFRSDLFAVGTVLYQMLCGRKPFIEDDHRSVMQKIRLERPTAVQRLNPDVPRELEKIINRCMEKRREDRFLSTQDLVSALERFLADRVEMNYHALLTYYLADQGVLSREELDAHVRPTLAGATKTTRTLAPHVDRSVRRLATWHGAILASMAILLGFVHATRLGAETRLEGSAPLGLGQSEGALRVLVDPWAEVWIDGKLLDTTPLSGPLTVPAGRHVLQLKNPYFVPDEREVTVEAGRIATVQTALRSAR